MNLKMGTHITDVGTTPLVFIGWGPNHGSHIPSVMGPGGGMASRPNIARDMGPGGPQNQGPHFCATPVVSMVDYGSKTTIVSRSLLHRVVQQRQCDGKRIEDAYSPPLWKGRTKRSYSAEGHCTSGSTIQG